MTLINIVTPCFNEEGNVKELYACITQVMNNLDYEYELIFIDNASIDNTLGLLKDLAAQDRHVKVIVNARNFGHIRSPYYGLLQCNGDVVISLASDLQDPPTLIPKFLEKWEEGFKVVLGVKTTSQESPILYTLRSIYYKTLQRFAETKLVEHYTGFGLYDQEVIRTLRTLQEPYPYLRGLLDELGYQYATVEYDQARRAHGITKNNFYTLYDLAMLGFTNHSRLPLRLAAMIGFISSIISFLVGMVYLIYKLVDWQNFSLGLAPVIVGLFFMGSIQLFFLGIVGEYVGAIYTRVQNRPLVIEKERINF